MKLLTLHIHGCPKASLRDCSSYVLDRIEKTVSIEAASVEIIERGVKLRLTVVDTPGFADAVDASNWWVLRFLLGVKNAPYK